MMFFKTGRVLLSIFTVLLLLGCYTESSGDLRTRLAEWRKGVWVSGDATYTIYTDSHYFVLSYEGDSSAPNIYFSASQVCFHNKGMARKQVVRLRQFPGGDLTLFKEAIFQSDNSEAPLKIDTTLFTPGTCTIRDGVIYDAIIEATDEYILLATCNDDRIKLFSNGVSAYLPAGGGEFYSYRVENF